MFGGKSCILRGGSVSLALVILIFLMLTLLVSEENPLRASLFDAQRQFSASPPPPPPPPSFSVCNYAKGKWVKDKKRPLYSGSECKQWLSSMWACRVMGRPDFSFEGYRWQPQGCNMPQFDRFTFLTRMQNKTIAFIGDSLGRQQFQSLMCMATGGEDSPEVQNVGWEYGLVKPKGALRPDGWAYRFPTTNTTILYYWSASLSDLVPMKNTDPPRLTAMHLDRPPAFMRNYLHRFDVLVLNTGHHWNRGKIEGNHWVMHVNGTQAQGEFLKDISHAKVFTIRSVAKWLDAELPLHPRLKAFFRTISPRHFRNGDWNTGGNCNNTVPLSRGSEINGDDGSVDTTVESAVNGTRIKILDITALSELRDEAHISGSKLKPRKPKKMKSNVTSTAPVMVDSYDYTVYTHVMVTTGLYKEHRNKVYVCFPLEKSRGVPSASQTTPPASAQEQAAWFHIHSQCPLRVKRNYISASPQDTAAYFAWLSILTGNAVIPSFCANRKQTGLLISNVYISTHFR
ncbi:BnaC02g42870D [Brassica napus]|uniref:BnaC02g42870D protein n=1 Tax=Brassica napus TaxID=3708 RepID=A0A078HQB3_BRANA|nr:BnaC02g42870D [Brassica napus]